MPRPPGLQRRLAPLATGILALAVGIVVGAGPLSDVGTGSDRLAARTGGSPLAADDATARALAAAEELAAVAAPRLHGDVLSDRTVAVVAMPDAERGLLDALRDQVAATGARVSATYTLGEEAVAPGGTALVDSLSRRLLDQQPGLRTAADAPTYERAGALMGMVVASLRPDGQQPVPATVSVAESLRTAGLLDGPSEPRRRAPLVLVVLGPGTGDPEDPAALAASDTVTEGLVTGLAGRALGTVVVASADSGAGGALGRLRATGLTGPTGIVATVDGVEHTSGQVLAGLALTRVADGDLGDWGVWGDDGVVPSPAP